MPLLLVLFVGSGCAALIYEIVWLQLLQLIIGSTAISVGVLLGTFMGGMCLGSLLLPRLISSKWHPLRVYATLEFLIGIMGLLVLTVMPWVSDAYTAYAGAGWMGLILRGLVAGICLLPPTLLMGATLPAIARWVQTTREGVSWLGFFYGGNIVGAVFGCLLAGFYLLRVYDMAVATHVAVVVNFTVAAAAQVFALVCPYRRAEPAAAPRSREERAIAKSAASLDWSVYVTIALSGFTGLAAEVVWTRLLSLMLGMTVYAFSNILAVFLIGLGIGSSLGAMIGRMVERPRLALGMCQILLAGACAWAAYNITYSLPYWPVLPSLAISPWYTFQLDLARCFWVVLPGALLWGASFPLALASIADRDQDSGQLVGSVYAANTVGAIFGALLFSMIIIPRLGTQGAQQILVAVCAFSALFMLVPVCIQGWRANQADPAHRPLTGPLSGTIGILAALVLVTGMICYIAPVPWVAVAFGRFSADPDTTNVPDRTSLYVGEGMNVSVAVTQLGDYRYFHGAGKVQASSWPQDMHLQRMLGHLSALIAKKNENVLVVACGAGVTAGSFVPYPTVKHITICDIESLVPQNVAQKYFSKENYGVVVDPRTHVVIDDGRHFIRTTKDKFDIITSDPIDPWVKGCAALNTVEYYQMCKQHLNPGGVVSLWIPLYESKLESAKSLITTFFQVFPNGYIFSNDIKGEGYDAVLLGQADPGPIDIDKMETLLEQPEYAKVKQSLMDVGFGTTSGASPAVELLATFAGHAPDLQGWMKSTIDNGDINTDSNLRLQYLAGMWLNNYEQTAILQDMLKYYRFPREQFAGTGDEIDSLQHTLEDEGRARFVQTGPKADQGANAPAVASLAKP
ncbi:MAG: fused MFS/spermidine synthase [Tepidisphaeraceae bacterium]